MKELINTIKNSELTIDENAELQMSEELAELISGGKGDTETPDAIEVNIICHVG